MASQNFKKFKAIIFSLMFLTISILTFAKSSTHPTNTISKASIKIVGAAPENVLIDKLPRKSEKFEVDSIEYAYNSGYFYITEGENYVRTKAPIGVTVKSIPEDYQRIIMAGKIYYYSKGEFYMVKNKKEYITVYGPQGGQVAKLPEGCITVSIKGRNYYMYHDAIFKKGESRSRKYYELYGYVSN